jgi:hypothetical protein
MAAAGADVAGSRGGHLISALAVRGGVVFGPVVPRDGAPTREQYLVAADDWLPDAAAPAEPWGELFVRYLAGHAPATLDDFRWWAGVPSVSPGPRGSRRRSGHGARRGPFPRRRRASRRRARGSLRSARAAALRRVLPLVRGPLPSLPAGAPRNDRSDPQRPGASRAHRRGEVFGTWRHSTAVGRHHLPPMLDPSPPRSTRHPWRPLGRVARFLRAGALRRSGEQTRPDVRALLLPGNGPAPSRCGGRTRSADPSTAHAAGR